MKKILLIALTLFVTGTMYADKKCCKGKASAKKECCKSKKSCKDEAKASGTCDHGKASASVDAAVEPVDGEMHACCKKAVAAGGKACCAKASANKPAPVVTPVSDDAR